ncbi:MAG: molybdenum ABC transporter ATP-binding protein [Pseudomonadales bacterium]|jgi:molybdate transport system ATP-binding protein|nr:molybdenum ABC transporter ATP-binding protein [Pseudomonadales bacterium]MDP6470726.1 molybdenum ABC transporter ATP-binding protein [Pseudomonadales bacterium]MDP6828322.1 molybdenum ABC transporter ATP-binding protein [Pseudomonadales bacterium]MDP6972128.1 molybdenum ABC transporter ATP-binding protein [Pseudomonadales bacterium]|tara:strand:+ start:714 stop:1778 length:1065 start_codon:yes stop_codon:yes gene_type:complete
MSLDVRGTVDLGTCPQFKLDIDAKLPTAGITAVIGASGCGKTSLLRLLAGLDRHEDFEVEFDGDCWQGAHVWRPPHERPITMVPQHPMLFPHLSVLGNLRCVPGGGDTHLAIERFGLASLSRRYPDRLSGGEQQRVALARAFLKPAKLWMLDEPLASLDPIARADLAPLVAQVCRAAGQPVIYVTHSLTEVLQIADHLLVMEGGHIIGSGRPEEVAAHLDHPLSPLIEVGTILDCTFVRYHNEHDLSELRIGDAAIWIRGNVEDHGKMVRVQIPARDVALASTHPADTSVLNVLPVTITDLTTAPNGDVTVDLDCADQTLRARITTLSAERMRLGPGKEIFAMIKSVALEPRRD